MPFKLINAPVIFQLFINQVLKEYLDKFIIMYIDDIFIYLDTYEQYIEYVRKVLKKLRKAFFKFKITKCEFYKQEVLFLGYIVFNKGIVINLVKVKSIILWPTSTSKKAV